MGQGTGGALAEFRTGVEGQFDIWVSMQEILDAATRSAWVGKPCQLCQPGGVLFLFWIFLFSFLLFSFIRDYILVFFVFRGTFLKYK